MGTLEKMLDKLQESEKKVNEFADVLDSIENTSDKKKMLWKQIYEQYRYFISCFCNFTAN